MRKNLIVVRAGDQSLHRRWMDDSRIRSFDVLVSYYGTSAGRHESKADHYHAMRGPRWPAHDWLWRNRRDLFDAYERVAFVCDDVAANTATWNAMFDLSEFYGLDLAQPVIDGYVNVPITFRVPGSLLRYVNWVEVMCPVFSRRALALCGDTFRESVSGWSLGWLWCARLPYPEYKVAMVDRIHVTHTSQTRQGSLRPVLDALGVDPEVEAPAMLDRLGIVDRQRVEYGRLPLG
ncbi:MAG: hypothetical protein ACHQJ7_01500 [Vicinamibacteria bacterium]|jgi:hypothetical protein